MHADFRWSLLSAATYYGAVDIAANFVLTKGLRTYKVVSFPPHSWARLVYLNSGLHSVNVMSSY
jgi:hypothetical protein